MGGMAEIHFGQGRRQVLASRVESTRVTRSKQGMQVTITLHSPFPMLSSSLPSLLLSNLEISIWGDILPRLAAMGHLPKYLSGRV